MQAVIAVDGIFALELAPAWIVGKVTVAKIVLHQFDEFRSLIIFQRPAQFVEEFGIGGARFFRRFDRL